MACGRVEMYCSGFWHNLAHFLEKNEIKLYFEVMKIIIIIIKLN